MAKLVIKLNDEVLDHLEIKQGDMKIGRKPGCDVVLDNLAVSGEHANIFTIGDDSFIQDLNSTNGTFINNKRITKHHLHNGDHVVIGKHTLIYLTEHATVSEHLTEEFAKTIVINPARAESSAAAARPVPAAHAPAAVTKPQVVHGALFILSGASSGKRIELTKAVTNLGKTGKRAGTITRTNDGYMLMPGEDEEPPRLNGRPVASDGAKLKNGDLIEVAGTRLQFYLK